MKRIFSLSQYKVFWYILFTISLCIASWLHGNHVAYKEYQEKLTNEYIANQRALKRLYEENQEKEDKIVKDYLSQIEILKKQNEDISNAKISDVVECPEPTRVYINKTDTSRRVSKEKTKSNLLCYTESQLRDKIKASMDIGREADELAIKYKALLEVCK